jgi:hypothetical protein
MILNGGKLEVFLLRLERRQECTLSTVFYIILEVLVNARRQKWEIDVTQIGR